MLRFGQELGLSPASRTRVKSLPAAKGTTGRETLFQDRRVSNGNHQPDSLIQIIQQLPGYDPVATPGNCTFDHQAARNAIEFIEECCTFTQGAKAGEPFILETWEKAIVALTFGWKRPGGARRYREVLLFLGAATARVSLPWRSFATCFSWMRSPAPSCIPQPAKRDQTHFIFDPVRKMIQACPEMKEQATIFKNSIVVSDRVYKTISREATSEHGGSTHFAVVDELHAQPDRDLVDVLYTSTIKRDNPLILYVTTSDFERPGSICNEKHDYGCKVRDGVIEDPSFLPAIYRGHAPRRLEIARDVAEGQPESRRQHQGGRPRQACQKAQDIPRVPEHVPSPAP